MPDFDDEGGSSAKRDRGARLLRVANVLKAHPDGIRAEDIAQRLGISRRTAYRDLRALEGELAMPTWSEDGRWGMLDTAFLPPLKLTPSEAMAVFLAARLMVRYADKYDPDLASAFEKLAEGLPAPLTEHVARSLDVLQRARRDPEFVDHVHALTRAWAERRVVEIEYMPARYEGREREMRRATVRPHLIEPSTQTHALYLIGWDEGREGLRTFKIERIRAVTVTPRRFEPPEPGTVETMLRQAWDIIADQPATDVVLRFVPGVAGRVAETIWHPTQRHEVQADGSLVWRATVSGTIEVRVWVLSWGDEVEVLEPAALREDVLATYRRALEQAERRDGGSVL
jgi:predicted DNA-binding transcriptional regulator YafY